jgi:hypothetical protein
VVLLAACTNEQSPKAHPIFVDSLWRRDHLLILMSRVPADALTTCNGEDPTSSNPNDDRPEEKSVVFRFDAARTVNVTCQVEGVGSWSLLMPSLSRGPDDSVIRTGAAAAVLAPCEPLDRSLGETFGQDPAHWVDGTAMRCPDSAYDFRAAPTAAFVPGEVSLAI